MKKIFCSCLLLTLLLACSKKEKIYSTVTEPEYPWIGCVKASMLYVRKSPSQNADIVDKVSKGHRIDVTGITDKNQIIDNINSTWYEVQTMNGVSGYAFGAYIDKPTIVKDYTVTLTTVLKSPDSIGNSYERAIYLEKKILLEIGDKVERKEQVLKIRCSEKEIVFEDKKINTDSSVRYSLVHYYNNQKLFLIHVQYYEGSSYCLVDEKTGSKYVLWNEPIFSPDVKSFFCSSVDLVAQYTKNGIQVWTRGETGFDKVFEQELKWGAVSLAWKNDNEISMQRLDLNGSDYYIFNVEMILKDGKWSITE
ncbi:MAG TPA: SH3 domain-containing protein [Spirochaetota bacterium]|nr:SH3 domain-containing protein [Spirochaetota bacterium]